MQRLFQAGLAAVAVCLAGCAVAPTPFPTQNPPAIRITSITALDATGTPTPVPSKTPRPTARRSPTASPSPTPNPLACGSTRGTILDDELRSPVLDTVLHFRAYLPPCYGRATRVRYPVLYMFHGLAANEREWDELGLNETADRLIATRQIYPFITIMPRDRGEADLGEAVIEDLLPYVDANYRTLPDRGHRAIGGLSRGGGWAIFLGLKYAKLFSAFAGHSAAVQPYQAELIIPILRAMPERDFPRVYFDIGERDSLKPDNTDWLEARLTERGIPFAYHVYPGDHTRSYWSSHLEEYLRFYAAEWP